MKARWMSSQRLISVSHSGRQVAVRSADAIRVSSFGEAEPTTPSGLLGPVADFACAGDELWALTESWLWRAALRTGRRLDPIRMPGPGQELRISPDESSAVVRGVDFELWVAADRPTLRLEPRPAGEVVVPLAGRSFAEVGDEHVRFGHYGRPERVTLRLPPGGISVCAATAFSGRAIAILAQRADSSEILVARPNGDLVRRVSLPEPADRLLDANQGTTIVSLRSGVLLAIELRTGALLGRHRPPVVADDLALLPTGDHFLIAHARAPGDVQVLTAPLAVFSMPDQDARAGVAAKRPDNDGVSSAYQYGTLDVDLPQATDIDEAALAPLPVPPTRSRRPLAESQASSRALLEEALCHTSILLERLLFLSRNLGLLPRTTTFDDPLGAMVISDSDVATILATFRKIAGTEASVRNLLIQDPFEQRIADSRVRLRARLLDDASADTGLARIVQAFDLDDVMTDLFLLAVAPDLDLRIGRLVGFLNNDATQTRPKMGHLLMAAQFGLPAPDAAIFARSQRTLFDVGLLRRLTASGIPVVGQTVVADQEIVSICIAIVNHEDQPASRSWAELRWREEDKRLLRFALRRELQRAKGHRVVVLEGIRGSGRHAVASAAAGELGLALETCDLTALGSTTADEPLEHLTRAALRARVWGRTLVVRSDGIFKRVDRLFASLAELARVHRISCVVLARLGELEAVDPSVSFVRFEPPKMTRDDRRALWTEAFGKLEIEINDANLDDIAARYDSPPGRVWELAEELRFRREGQPRRAIEVANVRDTLRDLTVQQLNNLAKRYDSSITLADLLFPSSVVARLDELVHRLRHRHRVLSGWAFADKAHESYGVSTLFVGPPGTGKTAAAAAIANALHIDLYIVDFSSIMSKWVGETEQNLARIFDEAEASSVALLFDEADALFGKRSSEQDSSSDRYANLTINYLLQRMESFSGLAILTTNLESAMDEAFQRRITSRVRFPETDEELRRRLWEHMLPRGATYDRDVDLYEISARHKMQGAHIRRALTRAAFRAAASGRDQPVLSQQDLLWAATAEYEDMGRLAIGEDEEPTGS